METASKFQIERNCDEQDEVPHESLHRQSYLQQILRYDVILLCEELWHVPSATHIPARKPILALWLLKQIYDGMTAETRCISQD